MQKSAKSLLISYYLRTFAPDKEPFFDKRSAKAITCVPLVAKATGRRDSGNGERSSSGNRLVAQSRVL